MSPEVKTVVVGYDASAESQVALAWAASLARWRNLPLRVVAAHELDAPETTFGQPGVLKRHKQEADAAAAEGADRVKGGDLEIEARGVLRGAADALVINSGPQDILVVGHRGRGRMRQALLGSVAVEVLQKAEARVVVVRGQPEPLPTPGLPIVVGVDGSEQSVRALDEAASLAAAAGSPLHVIVAPKGLKNPDTAKRGGSPDELSSWTEQHVHKSHPELELKSISSDAGPVESLTEGASAATMIVLGAAGQNDLRHLILGSTSRAVVEKATCPVYLVR